MEISHGVPFALVVVYEGSKSAQKPPKKCNEGVANL